MESYAQLRARSHPCPASWAPRPPRSELLEQVFHVRLLKPRWQNSIKPLTAGTTIGHRRAHQKRLVGQAPKVCDRVGPLRLGQHQHQRRSRRRLRLLQRVRDLVGAVAHDDLVLVDALHRQGGGKGHAANRLVVNDDRAHRCLVEVLACAAAASRRNRGGDAARAPPLRGVLQHQGDFVVGERLWHREMERSIRAILPAEDHLREACRTTHQVGFSLQLAGCL
mmetsp:Transcript_95568/g.274241  ORF Transcript_95568/g.274241 Transcript_95568/m.274241 type:complete len:223 (-) Transcript_95568:377-1045(-)